MSEFLSDAWFASIEAAAADAAAPEGLELTIEQVVLGEPDVAWQVTVGGGAVAIDRAASGEADVRIITDRATATGIHDGSVSAQRAFLDGRMQIGGDMRLLMEHRATLTELAPALGLT